MTRGQGWRKGSATQNEPTTDDNLLDRFDIDDPNLPEWIEAAAMRSGGYPYDKKFSKKTYRRELELLQIELVKLQAHIRKNGQRLALDFEGRDAAARAVRSSLSGNI